MKRGSLHCRDERSWRCARGSLIVITRLGFAQWNQTYAGDATLTAAMLDRVLNYAHLAGIQGESFRLREKRRAGVLVRTNKELKAGIGLTRDSGPTGVSGFDGRSGRKLCQSSMSVDIEVSAASG